MKNNETAYTDQDLWLDVQKGSQKAFLELYDRYKISLQRVAFQKIDDPRDAEDIIQELFVRLWEQREKIQIDTNLSGYLHIALRNGIFNHYIHKKRHREALRSLGQQMITWVNDTDFQVRENELGHAIQKEIENLPPKMRKVFTLHRTGRYTYQEIAEKMGTSAHTVATQIRNTLRKLRARLGDFHFFIFIF